MKIRELIENFKTKSKYGFNLDEVHEVVQQFPEIDMDKFNESLMGNTGIIEDNQLIVYPHDFYLALLSGIEK